MIRKNIAFLFILCGVINTASAQQRVGVPVKPRVPGAVNPEFAQQPEPVPVKPRLPDKIDKQWEKAEEAVAKARERYSQANQKALEELAKQVLKIDPNFDVRKLGEQFKATVIVQQQELANNEVQAPVLGKDIVIGPNGHKYKLFDDNLSWEDAKKKCEAEGGHLLVIDDAAESNFIRTNLRPFLVQGNDQVWMGATKNGQGAWVWVTGRPMANLGWEQNHPVPDGGKDFLVMIGNGNFINERGNNRPGMRFICEWDK